MKKNSVLLITSLTAIVLLMAPVLGSAQCYCGRYPNYEPEGRVVFKSPEKRVRNNSYNNQFYAMPEIAYTNNWDGSDYSPGYRQASYQQPAYELPYYYPPQQQEYYPQNSYYPQQTRGERFVNTIQTIGQLIQTGTQFFQMHRRPQ